MWEIDDDVLLGLGFDVRKFISTPVEQLLPYSIRSITLQLGAECGCYYVCSFSGNK
jgi:hypothetical protein